MTDRISNCHKLFEMVKNYHGWLDALIDEVSKCLSKLFGIGKKYHKT